MNSVFSFDKTILFKKKNLQVRRIKEEENNSLHN